MYIVCLGVDVTEELKSAAMKHDRCVLFEYDVNYVPGVSVCVYFMLIVIAVCPGQWLIVKNKMCHLYVM